MECKRSNMKTVCHGESRDLERELDGEQAHSCAARVRYTQCKLEMQDVVNKCRNV